MSGLTKDHSVATVVRVRRDRPSRESEVAGVRFNAYIKELAVVGLAHEAEGGDDVQHGARRDRCRFDERTTEAFDAAQHAQSFVVALTTSSGGNLKVVGAPKLLGVFPPTE